MLRVRVVEVGSVRFYREVCIMVKLRGRSSQTRRKMLMNLALTLGLFGVINLLKKVELDEVLKLAHISGLSAYDCEYVALAQDLNICLVNSDSKIIKAFSEIAVSLVNFP